MEDCTGLAYLMLSRGGPRYKGSLWHLHPKSKQYGMSINAWVELSSEVSLTHCLGPVQSRHTLGDGELK